MKKEKYETPQTQIAEVELESEFMAGSIFDKDSGDGVEISEHEFAHPENDWDFDYSNKEWE